MKQATLAKTDIKRFIGFLLLIPLNWSYVFFTVLFNSPDTPYYAIGQYDMLSFWLSIAAFFGLIFLNYFIPQRAWQTGILYANELASAVIANRLYLILMSMNISHGDVDWVENYILSLILVFAVVFICCAAFLSVFIKVVKTRDTLSA